MVLGVGIDWAEAFHLVALGRPSEGVIQTRRVEHTPAVEGLLADLAQLEPDPAAVRVVLETRHGVLVELLVDAGLWCCQLGRARRRSRHLVASAHELRHQPPPEDPGPACHEHPHDQHLPTFLIPEVLSPRPETRQPGHQ